MRGIMKAAAMFGLTAALACPALAEGDAAYGEYLSGECVTCHRLDGSSCWQAAAIHAFL